MDVIDRETLLERLKDSRKSYEASVFTASNLGREEDAQLFGSMVWGLNVAIDIINEMPNCGEETEDAAPEGTSVESKA